MERTSVTSLPSELLCQIIHHLLKVQAFGSVAAFGQCGRRLYNCALPLLYKDVSSVHPLVGQDALIWAAENDEIDTLTALLEYGVDPNARFWSTLPDCARQGVFSAQNLGRRLLPKQDRHLIAALIQTEIVYLRRDLDWAYDSCFQEWYMGVVDGNIRIPDVYFARAPDEAKVTSLIEESAFGCCEHSDGPVKRIPPQYSWTAFHVAAKRGKQRAVQVLLDYGAEIELRCSGLCDCLVPVTPVERAPPSFTALHITVCSGHGEITRLLLGRGANAMVAGQMKDGVSSLHARPDDAIPALHSAALRGNVAMCQILLDHLTQRGSPDVGTVVGWCDARQRHAIDYAVAAGHTRTTGVWLLAREDNPLHQLTRLDRDFYAPLNLLCREGKYRDAVCLLDSLGNNNRHGNAYTLALQLCFVRSQPPPMPFDTVQTSLRHYLAEHTELLVSGEHKPPLEDGEEALICLVQRLLDLGADPSTVLHREGWVDYAWGQSALHLAAGRGEVKALATMLDSGAPLERYVIRPMLWGHPNNHTPLGAALLPPDGSPTIQDSRKYLEMILFLLERGASLQKALGPWQRPGPRVVLWPLFWTHECTRKPWYNSDPLDLFERILALAAAQHGKEPEAWAADVLYLSIMCGRPNGNLCKWLVKRFGLVPSDFPSKSLARMSPVNYKKRQYNEPGMMDWLLETLPETALNHELEPVEQAMGLAGMYAERRQFHAAKALVERGWVDRVPVIQDGQEPQAMPSDMVLSRIQFILYQPCLSRPCLNPGNDGAVELVRAILARAATLSASDRTWVMTWKGVPAISRLIRRTGHSVPRRGRNEAMELLRLLLKERAVPLYGVTGRFHGEFPTPGSRPLAAVYPVPVAVECGDPEVLELIFKETPPATSEEIQDILAMALDASLDLANPAILQVIIEHSPINLAALIVRTDTPNSNGVSGDISPLYYLLKSFYNKRIAPWQGPEGKRSDHDCDCGSIGADKRLVRCVALLVKHGASWTQPSEPSGDTALDVLAAILDTEDYITRDGDVDAYIDNLRSISNVCVLKRHIILDWRGADAAGRVRSAGFNPVEFAELGVQARW
ncbi:hypothetical protein B0J18DRAFT_31686 [Chaetomium sp. MPI-SDFR-AT-0129]|nr:hypothetical protein B0J18DRAFT_31686 [Chaetomium sp. MPI-SDFR-AT-0129]